MNAVVVQHAIGELQRRLAKARDALRQIEGERYGFPEHAERPGYVYPEAALGVSLDDLQQRLMVLLDAADMRETRASLEVAWASFNGESGGVSAVSHDDEFEYSHSPALSYIERVLETLRDCVDKGLSSAEATELERLEWILEHTAVLVHRRGASMSAELQLQQIMHDYLSAAFPEFVKDVRIPGGLKNFQPDCGVRGLGAAVEFKLVRSKGDVARAISGVIEDIGGYRGSKDWTRFYSVFYQAHPYITEAEVRRELRRAGGFEAWRPFVVTESAEGGSGKRGRTAKRATRSTRILRNR